MRARFLLAALVSATALAPAAAAAPSLSASTAQRALAQRLERYQGFRSVRADCRRRTRREQRCTWRGRRAGAAWRGTARVRRLAGGGIDVQVTSARRA